MNLPNRASQDRSRLRAQRDSRGAAVSKFFVGARFGKLVIKKRISSVKVQCACDCGNTKVAWTGNLDKQFTVSCGCVSGSKSVYKRYRCLLADIWTGPARTPGWADSAIREDGPGFGSRLRAGTTTGDEYADLVRIRDEARSEKRRRYARAAR